MNTIARVFGLTPVVPYESIHKPAEVTNPDLLLGLELEIEQLPEGLGYYTVLAGNGWSVVEDGSLRPRGQAWEFVSRPTPLAKAVQELRLLLGKLRLDERNYSDRTSVHVHTNVQDFTQEQLATLCMVYVCVEDVLFQFVNRFKVANSEGMSRDTNIYCVPWSQCRMNQKLIERLIYAPGEVPSKWQKYSALNLIPVSSQGTVEWRHMHGTNDMEKLSIWLNVIGSIMAYSKNTPFEEVVKTLKALNNVSTYQQFYTSVMGTQIPYTEEYRSLLAEGCVNAKYSLINWEVSKRAGKKVDLSKKKPEPIEGGRFRIADFNLDAPAQPAPAVIHDDFDEPIDAEEADQLQRIREEQRRQAALVAEQLAAARQAQVRWDAPAFPGAPAGVGGFGAAFNRVAAADPAQQIRAARERIERDRAVGRANRPLPRAR